MGLAEAVRNFLEVSSLETAAEEEEVAITAELPESILRMAAIYMEAEEEARRQEEARREADKAIVEQQKKLRQSRSISGRVEARLLELRSDDAARLELENRVTMYKQQRADGLGQVVDFVLDCLLMFTDGQ